MVGLLPACWGTDIAAGMAPPGLELRSILYIDRNVLAFSLALALLAGVLTGVAPALSASRTNVGEILKQGG